MANEDIITPQWALPFQFTPDGDVLETEQGSDEELQNNIWVILSYEPGQLLALPDFGISESVFSKSGTNLDTISKLIQRWEPDANEIVEHDSNWFATAVDSINVRRSPVA